jgi:iron(III) transport system ATP-binding protein
LQLLEGVTAIVGYSGAGKTSLLNLLAGFEKPDGGLISGAPAVAWAPQNGGLWPHLNVCEHLQTVCPATRKEEWMALLADFDLTGKLDSRPDELSEGEQSRLSVARALMMPSRVAVMDEPLVHVDPARTEVCWQAIRRHLASGEKSLIFSTHSSETVLGEASRVVCLGEGRLLYEGGVNDLYWRAPSAELARFLGPVNWFTPGEALQWLGVKEEKDICRRPEQIALAAAPDGRFSVETARFRGSAAAADLAELATGTIRRFYHRPSHDWLRPGDRVTMRVVP